MTQCYEDSDRPAATPVDHFGGQQPVWLKRHTAVIRRGHLCNLQITMRDSVGNPLNLSDCYDSGEGSSISGDDAPTPVFRIVEPISRSCDAPLEMEGEITDPAAGLVTVALSAAAVAKPAIYHGELALPAGDGLDSILASTQICLWVEAGLFGGGTQLQGPPQLQDIRLRLRDFPQENELIDTFDFDNGEIAHALVQPVRDWNEATPRLRKTYNTGNFPYQSNWISAACGYLFRIAAEHYRRNRLPYQAGGNGIDDKAKAADYEKQSELLLAEWRAFVKSQKVAENIRGGYGSLGSGYSSWGAH